MRLINRTAVTLIGAKPYLEWTLQKEAAFQADTLRVVRPRTFGSAFLLPEFELEEDVLEWVERTPAGCSSSSLPRGPRTIGVAGHARSEDVPQWFRIDIHRGRRRRR
jgi:hypothetical protein